MAHRTPNGQALGSNHLQALPPPAKRSRVPPKHCTPVRLAPPGGRDRPSQSFLCATPTCLRDSPGTAATGAPRRAAPDRWHLRATPTSAAPPRPAHPRSMLRAAVTRPPEGSRPARALPRVGPRCGRDPRLSWRRHGPHRGSVRGPLRRLTLPAAAHAALPPGDPASPRPPRPRRRPSPRPASRPPSSALRAPPRSPAPDSRRAPGRPLLRPPDRGFPDPVSPQAGEGPQEGHLRGHHSSFQGSIAGPYPSRPPNPTLLAVGLLGCPGDQGRLPGSGGFHATT